LEKEINKKKRQNKDIAILCIANRLYASLRA